MVAGGAFRLRRLLCRAQARVALGGPDAEGDARRSQVTARLTQPVSGEPTPDERAAIARYKKPEGYAGVNDGLRGRATLSEMDADQAVRMVDGLRKLPPHTGAAFRGANTLIGGVTQATVGEIYEEKGFLSASKVPGGAFPGRFKIRIVGRGSVFDVSGIVDETDLNDINLDHFEEEVVALPGMRVRYLGEVDGWHRYEEVR